MSRILQDARRVLDAYHEGIVSGIILCIEHHIPKVTKKELGDHVKEILHDWKEMDVDYWLEYFGIGKFYKEQSNTD